MDIFISRQPIFDDKMRVFGYSILTGKNTADKHGDEITAATIIDGPLMMGMKTLTEHKKAFITFTGRMILDDMAVLLNPSEFVIDIVDPYDKENLSDAIKDLKEKGYTIAVDGKEHIDILEMMIDNIDIIRIDFNTTDIEHVTKITGSYANDKVKKMAVNVNEREQFEMARVLNFDYLSGHFFMRPTMIVSKDIQVFKNAHLKLMTELHQPSPEFDKIAAAVESDLSLCYKILKLVNSSAYSGVSKISDIHQALVRIGMKDLYKWFSLIVLREFSDGQPSVYAWTSIIRAKVLENLASLCGIKGMKEELFILGMFSMIDIILQRPMEEILNELPLSDQVCNALRGEDNVLSKGLRALEAYEKGEWDKVIAEKEFGNKCLDKMMPQCFFSALKWVEEIHDE